jgi:hypothetical protein
MEVTHLRKGSGARQSRRDQLDPSGSASEHSNRLFCARQGRMGLTHRQQDLGAIAERNTEKMRLAGAAVRCYCTFKSF